MPKDYKIGMMVGLVMVVGTIVWLSTSDSLSLQARRAQKHRTLLEKQTQNKAIRSASTSDQQVLAPNSTEQNAGDVSSPPPEVSAPSPDPPSDLAAAETPVAPSQSETSDQTQRPKIATTKFHIVRSGDTLSGISLEYYGTVRDVKKIVQANHDVFKDPNKIRPGMKLTIPD